MKKVAIFVEGYTEFYFVERLVEEVAGWGKVRLELNKQHAGRMQYLRTVGAPEEVALLTIMLVNCCGDGSVKSFILERKSRLISAGYTYILGLQDLYPKQIVDLERFQLGILKGLEDPDICIEICIAVAEIESWFLNEVSHYLRVDPRLTCSLIKGELGFDPGAEDAEFSVRHPSRMLHDIYSLAGCSYKKNENDIKSLVGSLDYNELYENVRARSASLSLFFDRIDSCFEFGKAVQSA